MYQKTLTSKYLLSGKTLEDLRKELGIRSFRHPNLPLIGFSYSQFDSPKTHPIVRECRGLVLEEGTWNTVAKPFPRFFNMGEDLENQKAFQWEDSEATSKEDGSLCILYHYAGEWQVNTRGSFALSSVHGYEFTWRDLFWKTFHELGLSTKGLFKDETYLFELCTLYNQVVRRYSIPQLFLLGIYGNRGLEEISPRLMRETAKCIGCPTPETFAFPDKEALTGFLRSREEANPTYEGVVLRDSIGHRIKVKTQTYLGLHHLHDNGQVARWDRLMPHVLARNTDEIAVYFPELITRIAILQSWITKVWEELSQLWEEHKDKEVQKDFALAVKDHPLSGLLFQLRKEKGISGTKDDLWAKLRDAQDRLSDLVEKDLGDVSKRTPSVNLPTDKTY